MPSLVWVAVLALFPMDWARRAIEEELRELTGQSVRVGAVRLGWFGGLDVTGVTIASEPKEAPWLAAGKIQVEVPSSRLWSGSIRPSMIRVAQLELVILRDSSGHWPAITALESQRHRSRDDNDREFATIDRPADEPETRFEIRNGRIRVVDEATGVELVLERVSADGRRGASAWRIDQLAGNCNGGRISIAGELQSGPTGYETRGQLQAESISVGRELAWLRPLAPLVLSSDVGAHGILAMDLFAQSRASDVRSLGPAITGRGRLRLDPITIGDSRLVREIAPYLKISSEARVGSLEGEFLIQNQRISTQDLVWNISDLPLHMSGWTDFSGQLDYTVQTKGLAGKLRTLSRQLPEEARQLFGELPIDLDALAALRIVGTMNAMEIRPGGAIAPDRAKPGSAEGLDRWGQMSRRIREHLLR
jgi:hypothetical protein